MYINDGLMGVSDDLLHWDSIELEESWPGGEGCFAITDYDAVHPENIIFLQGVLIPGIFMRSLKSCLKNPPPLIRLNGCRARC